MIRTFKTVLCVVASVTGIATLCLLIRTPVTEWGLVPTVAAGAIIASCIAALAALAVSETVAQRRDRETQEALRSRREHAYDRIVAHMIKIFTGGSSIEQEVEVRAAVALWAGPEVVRLMGDWNGRTHRITSDFGGTVPGDEKRALQAQLAEAVLAMRVDLSGGGAQQTAPAVGDVARMIFNDYQ